MDAVAGQGGAKDSEHAFAGEGSVSSTAGVDGFGAVAGGTGARWRVKNKELGAFLRRKILGCGIWWAENWSLSGRSVFLAVWRRFLRAYSRKMSPVARRLPPLARLVLRVARVRLPVARLWPPVDFRDSQKTEASSQNGAGGFVIGD
jgi:hypothetical protein